MQTRQDSSGSSLSSLLSQARQAVGNDPRAAIAKMQSEGLTVSLPNGKVLPIGDVAAMAEGKSAAQFLSEIMR